jgi:uncharacterized iron-regulated membrane protein
VRTIFFWIHLAAGTAAGAVILVMSVTGALLAFQPQVLRLVEGRQRTVVTPAPRPARLGPEELLARVLRERPDARPASVTFDSDPAAAASIGIGREGVLYVDPYAGVVTGEGSKGWRGFFQAVTDWHRWLAVSGERRATARAVTGASNAAFLFLSLSGLYLWWPRQWTWRRVRPIVAFERGLRGKARDFNWHNVIGLWSAPVIFLLTLTALPISYASVGNLLYAATPPGAAAPPPNARPAGPPAIAGLDRAWALAQAQMPGWTLIAMRLPPRPDAPVSVAITESASRSPFGRSQLSVDPATGDVVRWEPFGGFSRGRTLRVAARWTHTGEIAAWPGQLLAGLASLGGAFLVWTGWSLAWRRFRGWRRASAVAAAPAAEAGPPAAA